MTGIQALERKYPTKPMQPGKTERRGCGGELLATNATPAKRVAILIA